MTREQAAKLSEKAGDKNMKEHGRTEWNAEDFDCAILEFNKLRLITKNFTL